LSPRKYFKRENHKRRILLSQCSIPCQVIFLHRCYILSAGPALKLKLIYDRQSVGQSVIVSGTHLGPATNFFFR
jgi:hypothetical protein